LRSDDLAISLYAGAHYELQFARKLRERQLALNIFSKMFLRRGSRNKSDGDPSRTRKQKRGCENQFMMKQRTPFAGGCMMVARVTDEFVLAIGFSEETGDAEDGDNFACYERFSHDGVIDLQVNLLPPRKPFWNFPVGIERRQKRFAESLFAMDKDAMMFPQIAKLVRFNFMFLDTGV
jgi:hypothetical protein